MILLKTVNSTNTYIKENINSLADRSIVIAESQTGGRGRFGRTFVSESGGLYMSLLLKNVKTDMLTVCGGVSVADVLCGIGADVKIKWVNDVYCKGKKVCGILAEAVNGNAIIGIGVNVKHSDSLPDVAYSLEKLYGINIDTLALGKMIADKFFEYVNDTDIIDRYRYYTSHMIGKRVAYNNGDGIVKCVTDNGNLSVINANGDEITLYSGEISVKMEID